jgi:hypothetical protein
LTQTNSNMDSNMNMKQIDPSSEIPVNTPLLVWVGGDMCTWDVATWDGERWETNITNTETRPITPMFVLPPEMTEYKGNTDEPIDWNTHGYR